MNKEASKLYDEFFDKWINIFVPDEGDNRLECEYALHKFIEALQEDKWISVEDELPESKYKSVDVLGCSLMSNTVAVMYYDSKKNIWIRKYDGTAILWKVTHWQPLPKPPITNKPKKRGGCNP